MKQTLWNSGWTFSVDGEPGCEQVTLPHDAMMHGGRSPQSPAKDAMGYFTGGVYRYRKAFRAPAAWEGRHVEVAFDGVMRNATVLLNGQELARHAYGYTPFAVDITDAVDCGDENLLEVIADNSELPCSRWYTGAGIYRDVHLLEGAARHITWRGLRIDTLAHDPARIRVRTELAGPALPCERIRVEVLDGERVLARAEGADVEIEVPDAVPWSDERPRLYTCHATLLDGEDTVDTAQEDFGIRTLSWSGEGLFVNGKPVLLRGGCVHHDNGVLGAVSCAEAEERRVRIMKESGFNAIRSSHNPASTALLNACDRLGMYVMDESFDMWYQHKNSHDYAGDFEACHLDDLSAMVERDRNHPSVIMYSIGNEVSEPAHERGLAVAREMIDHVHALDPTRPVTAGINFLILMMEKQGKGLYAEGGAAATAAEKPAPEAAAGSQEKSGSLVFNTMMSTLGRGMNLISATKKADEAASPVLDMLDICGYNYAAPRYRKEGKRHPGRTIVGSETLPQDIAGNWALVERLPYLIGDFMWTGWDYLGEAAIGAWNYEGTSMANVTYPWLLSGAGVIDITGRPDAEAAYAATVWGRRTTPYIGVRPVNHPGVRVTRTMWRGTNAFDSWSWAGCEGEKATVEVYGRGATVELVQNGRKLGRKRLKRYRATYTVRYEPGTLMAIVYALDGTETGRTQLISATGTAKVCLRPEKTQVKEDETLFAHVEVLGDNGVMESNADRRVSVEVTGGELLGFGSAQPNPEGTYTRDSCRTWYGHALAAVRATGEGPLTIRVRDEAGETSEVTVQVS